MSIKILWFSIKTKICENFRLKKPYTNKNGAKAKIISNFKIIIWYIYMHARTTNIGWYGIVIVQPDKGRPSSKQCMEDRANIVHCLFIFCLIACCEHFEDLNKVL